MPSQKRKIRKVRRTRQQTQQRSALVVHMFGMDAIRPHPQNARVHDDANVEGIMRSMDAFGQRTPIVVWGSLILKGCGTFEAARRLGWKTIQGVDATDELTEEQALAYSLADNKTGDTSRYNYGQVSETLRFLAQTDIDLETTGFAGYELNPLLAAEWTPSDVAKLPGSEDEPDGEDTETGHTVTFTDEQFLRMRGAVAPVRKHFAREPALLEIIVRLVELGATVKKRKTKIRRRTQ